MNILRWVKHAKGETLPQNIVVGGHRDVGDILHVSRVPVNGAMLPGKFYKPNDTFYHGGDGKETRVYEGELLVCDDADSLKWVTAANGDIPLGAVIGGYAADGEVLYIGRASRTNELVPGRVSTTNMLCYFTTCNLEFSESSYEVLALKSVKPAEPGASPPRD